MRILHLHVKKEYWEDVHAGIKDEEYREIKDYWTKRLKQKYDYIYYYLGYTGKIMIFPWNGFKIKKILHKHFGDKIVTVYAIKLTGEIR